MQTTATINKGGRPKGSRPVNRQRLIACFNRNIEPFSDELLQRAIDRALTGDTLALSALIELWGRVLASSSDSRAQATIASTQ
ncbi:MAG: hypothetical protein LBU72_08355 [Burkholderiaceae bacterium]|jgi:hypothetical protein|nr:hypothetical protein [Burkholderiaceae bacterium]